MGMTSTVLSDLRELASGFKSTPRLSLGNVFSLRKEKVVLPAKQREQGDAIIYSQLPDPPHPMMPLQSAANKACVRCRDNEQTSLDVRVWVEGNQVIFPRTGTSVLGPFVAVWLLTP